MTQFEREKSQQESGGRLGQDVGPSIRFILGTFLFVRKFGAVDTKTNPFVVRLYHVLPVI
jgi:hypothetical protein